MHPLSAAIAVRGGKLSTSMALSNTFRPPSPLEFDTKTGNVVRIRALADAFAK